MRITQKLLIQKLQNLNESKLISMISPSLKEIRLLIFEKEDGTKFPSIENNSRIPHPILKKIYTISHILL